MARALDTSSVVLPGLSTPRLLARLSGMLLLSFCGALLTGYAAFLVLFLESGESLAELPRPWQESAWGMFFWPFVLFGTLWAWCWSFANLWNRRWILASSLVILATNLVVVPLTFASPMLAAFAGYSVVAIACEVLGGAKWTLCR